MTMKTNKDVEEAYKSFTDELDLWKEQFEKEHPFYNWFDIVMGEYFGIKNIASWSPHQIFENPLKVIQDIGREIRWAYQRVRYGVDERASWGVGYWLMDVMPVVLKNIKGSSYGIPLSFFSEKSLQDFEPSENDSRLAAQKYDKVIEDILWGFEELKRLEDVSVYGKNGIGIDEFLRRKKLAKEKISLLIEYFYEIGD